MDSRMLKRTQLGILVLVSALLLGSTGWARPVNVVEAANKAAINVGKVGQTDSNGKKGPVFVFEELHTSRVGQLQIAVMLLRLHGLYGLKTIGLEGASQSTKPLDGGWFQTAGGPTAKSFREDVAVRMLAEGEISAAEFMTLVFADVKIYGIELQEEYDIKLDIKGSPAIRYLFAIAERYLTQADVGHINDLQSQQRLNEAVEYKLTRDPWVSEQYQAIKNPSVEPVENSLERYRAIQKKASDLSIKIDPKIQEDMNKVLLFDETAAKRTVTMVNNTLRLPGIASGIPVALSIGAAHTEGALKLLHEQNAAFAQLAPVALNPDYGMQSLAQFGRKDELKWARTNPGTLGRLLNAQRKPPPIIGTATAHSYASLNLAVLIVADAAKKKIPIPDGVWSEISALPDLKVDRNSFETDGSDVIFRAWPKDTEGKDKEVWVRAGTANTPAHARSLEEKLLQVIADLGGGGPPEDPPPHTTGTKDDEGPGDGKRGETVVNRVSSDALAVYAESRDTAQKVGQISG